MRITLIKTKKPKDSPLISQGDHLEINGKDVNKPEKDKMIRKYKRK